MGYDQNVKNKVFKPTRQSSLIKKNNNLLHSVQCPGRSHVSVKWSLSLFSRNFMYYLFLTCYVLLSGDVYYLAL